MSKTTHDQELERLEQKIRELQMRKQKLKRKKTDEERKQRNHAMILIGSTVMTHFPNMVDEIINSDDDKIKAFAHSLFNNKEPDTAHNGTAPDTEHDNKAAETQHEFDFM